MCLSNQTPNKTTQERYGMAKEPYTMDQVAYSAEAYNA